MTGPCRVQKQANIIKHHCRGKKHRLLQEHLFKLLLDAKHITHSQTQLIQFLLGKVIISNLLSLSNLIQDQNVSEGRCSRRRRLSSTGRHLVRLLSGCHCGWHSTIAFSLHIGWGLAKLRFATKHLACWWQGLQALHEIELHDFLADIVFHETVRCRCQCLCPWSCPMRNLFLSLQRQKVGLVPVESSFRFQQIFKWLLLLGCQMPQHFVKTYWVTIRHLDESKLASTLAFAVLVNEHLLGCLKHVQSSTCGQHGYQLLVQNHPMFVLPGTQEKLHALAQNVEQIWSLRVTVESWELQGTQILLVETEPELTAWLTNIRLTSESIIHGLVECTQGMRSSTGWGRLGFDDWRAEAEAEAKIWSFWW